MQKQGQRKTRTRSQVLRAVLYLRWEREVGSRGDMEFVDFYDLEMNKIIRAEQDKL